MNVLWHLISDNGHNIVLIQSSHAATADVAVHQCPPDLRVQSVILRSPLHFY